MSKDTKIQWTDATWNIARGCTKVDEDCKFCYMYRESLNGTRYEPKQVVRTKTVFNLPMKLKEPSRIFASSLTDWGHPDIDPYRHEFWQIIQRCPQHTFQCLTKRIDRADVILPEDWDDGYDNVWLGTSIGSTDSIIRLQLLLAVKAKVRFLSIEPMHGPVDISDFLYPKEFIGMPTESYDGKWHSVIEQSLHWVIIGGESGNENGQYRYRECKIEWIESIIAQCKAAGVPVFVKQLGTHLAKKMGLSDRHGGNIEEWPEHLRIRQFPEVARG